jgi:hypothetical protein
MKHRFSAVTLVDNVTLEEKGQDCVEKVNKSGSLLVHIGLKQICCLAYRHADVE